MLEIVVYWLLNVLPSTCVEVLKFANSQCRSDEGPGNGARRELVTIECQTGNPIDDCWRCDNSWESNRQSLADCAIGSGKNSGW